MAIGEVAEDAEEFGEVAVEMAEDVEESVEEEEEMEKGKFLEVMIDSMNYDFSFSYLKTSLKSREVGLPYWNAIGRM